jgi:hypothetical protein
VLLAAVCARAAGMEDTAACAGKKELSDGMWFSLDVCSWALESRMHFRRWKARRVCSMW